MRYRLLQARTLDEPVRAEERAAFAARLSVEPSTIETHDLLTEKTTFQAVTRDVDIVLVGGSGKFSIYDDVAWMEPFLEVLGELATADFPTFASCFGFQGLVRALGKEVRKAPEAAEVGTFAITLTDEGANDPLFHDFPRSFHAQAGHKDAATSLPKGAKHLAFSERCPFQALRLGNAVYATQFHPELSESDNRQRFIRYYDDYSDAFGPSEAKAILEAFAPSDEASQLLPRFRDLIAG